MSGSKICSLGESVVIEWVSDFPYGGKIVLNKSDLPELLDCLNYWNNLVQKNKAKK